MLEWRLRTRCSDDLCKVAGKNWLKVAEDRTQWRAIGKDYVQQWTSKADDDDDDE